MSKVEELRKFISEVSGEYISGKLPEVLNYNEAERRSRLLERCIELVGGYFSELGGSGEYSNEEIIGILSSITRIYRDNCGNIEVWFEGGHWGECINSFIPGSFTRELLELVDRHME